MKAKFTVHDTFPLRYGWLYKAVNYLNHSRKLQTSNEEKTRAAIVELGVGKNMVNANLRPIEENVDGKGSLY